MTDITDLLRPHVADLKADLDANNATVRQYAEAVISLHRMHVSFPSDPGAPALCEAAFEKWQQARAETNK